MNTGEYHSKSFSFSMDEVPTMPTIELWKMGIRSKKSIVNKVMAGIMGTLVFVVIVIAVLMSTAHVAFTSFTVVCLAIVSRSFYSEIMRSCDHELLLLSPPYNSSVIDAIIGKDQHVDAYLQGLADHARPITNAEVDMIQEFLFVQKVKNSAP